MAVKEKTGAKEIRDYTGKRVPKKLFKLFMAQAKTHAERRALKSLYLGPEARFFSKASAEPEGVETDLPIGTKAK